MMPLDKILSNNASNSQNQVCLSISCLYLRSVFLKCFVFVKKTLIRLEQNVCTIRIVHGPCIIALTVCDKLCTLFQFKKNCNLF